MTLEKLPNEILIECFEYFNAMDIFYSFDQLNSRFNILIQCIRLHVNFENVRKSIFDQFCAKILSNPEIKNKIISLKLSNKDTCHQIDQFLSLFSLDEFSNLQSLTLNDVKYNNIEKLQSILPLMLKLSCFHSIDSKYNLSTIVQLSHLQTLAIYDLSFCTNNIDRIFSLVNLTISKCCLKELYKFLSCTPMLEYLNVYTLLNTHDELQFLWNKTYSTHHNAKNLQKIIINDLQEDFPNFEIFLKQTPNLKSLKISSNNETMVNADNWQHLITTSLHNLNIFKFKFTYLREEKTKIIVDKFKQFENSFWQGQHRWIIEYVLEKDLAYIYTIPYISNTYKLTPTTDRFSNKLINDVINLTNVTNLILYQKTMKEKTEFKYYFSNVETLTLEDESHREYWYLMPEHVQLIKMIVNLDNLKHLNISSTCTLDLSLVLLEILKHSPQLSSLTIVPYGLPIEYTDQDLFRYLNNKIKQLDIYQKKDSTMDEFATIIKFCEIYSNIERLKCNIHRMDNILYLLNNLRKLLFLNIIVPFTKQTFIDQLEDKILNLNITYEIIYHYFDEDVDKAEICMWMG